MRYVFYFSLSFLSSELITKFQSLYGLFFTKKTIKKFKIILLTQPPSALFRNHFMRLLLKHFGLVFAWFAVVLMMMMMTMKK